MTEWMFGLLLSTMLVGGVSFTNGGEVAPGDCTFVSEGSNPYLPLRPGLRLRLEGVDNGRPTALEYTILHETRLVPFEVDGKSLEVETRVVEERESVDGRLVEISRNFLAECRETGDVYYFGEDVDFYRSGEVAGHDGAWLAGEDGAEPGLLMPGTIVVGDRFVQEWSPGRAEDHAEIVRDGVTVETRAGVFQDCVELLEIDPLEDDEGEPRDGERKLFCRGVGPVVDQELLLVRIDEVE